MSKDIEVRPQLSQEEREAVHYVRNLRNFYGNLIGYLIVMPILYFTNIFATPHISWFFWVAFGWGIGVVFHGLTVFGAFSVFSGEWEQRQIDKRLKRD